MKEKDNGMIDVEVSREAAEATERIRRHIESLPEEKRPKVCIKCITYNHGEFIRETLDGFLMQQTDFPFVAIVHDDASTDNTADIVREYAERYPDIIFPIFETENQYRKPGGPLTKIMQDAIDATGARYVAMCEGDDYWTSPHKLQLQADFLDTHPDYVMCSTHAVQYAVKDNRLYDVAKPDVESYDKDVMLHNDVWPMRTLTLLYRSKILDRTNFFKYSKRTDTVLFWSLLSSGHGYFIPDATSVYRVHSGGVWSALSDEKKWHFDFDIRKSIYEIDNDKDSAVFLGNMLKFRCGRSYILSQKKS